MEKTGLFDARPFTTLDKTEQQFIRDKTEELHLSFQQVRRLIEAAADLRQWEETPVSLLWDESNTDHLKGKLRGKKILERIFSHIEKLRENPIDYSSFSASSGHGSPVSFQERRSGKATLLGTCPVAGEKTRCCNLLTLDAVEQCGFGCSYCSIQSFYGNHEVYFIEDLHERLIELEQDLDSNTIYHIGTGQSSDSLMWGNRKDLLNDLFGFAERNPNVLLELKTKSANTSWLKEIEAPLPSNVISTWSLNPQVIIEHEEHGTASLSARLAAARTIADTGALVGFHFHPMIYFSGWEKEYAKIAETIEQMFSPEETVMISLGTLTFIKPVIKQLRESGLRSRVLQIPLEDSAGKYTYREETKAEMFSHLYNSFSPQWQKSLFFYLCMEPHSLWEKTFCFNYPDNAAFEAEMKRNYMKKVKLARIRKKKYN